MSQQAKINKAYLVFNAVEAGCLLPLKPSNLELWESALETYISQYDAWEVVTGEEPRPKITASPDTELRLKQVDEEYDWTKRDRFARAAIRSTLTGSNVLLEVHDLKTSNAIYKHIKERFLAPTPSARWQLQGKLEALKWNRDEDFDGYYHRLKTVASELRAQGVQITDETLMHKIFNELPDTFEAEKVVWNDKVRSHPEEATLENFLYLLKTRFTIRGSNKNTWKSKERQFQSKNQNKSESGRAFHAKNQNKKNKQSSTQEKRCFVCGKANHLAKDCWQRKDGPSSESQGHEKKSSPQKQGKDQGYKKGQRTHKDTRRAHSKVAEVAQSDEPEDGDSSEGIALMTRALSTEEKSTEMTHQVLFVVKADPSQSRWILDSGCSNHMSSQRDNFTNIRPTTLKISTAGQEVIEAAGIGDIPVEVYNGQKWKRATLKDVLYVPALSEAYNLFSLSQLNRKFSTKIVTNGTKGTLFTGDGEPMVEMDIRGGLFHLKIRHLPTAAVAQTNWHERFGHISKEKIITMVKNKAIEGVKLSEVEGAEECHECPLGKLARKASKKVTVVSSLPGHRLYMDLAGPFPVESLEKAKYYMLTKDEATSYIYIRLLSTKASNKVSRALQELLIDIRAHTPWRVTIIRTDNGREFDNEVFDEVCFKNEIKHERIIPESPQMNGRIERENRTIASMIRTYIHGERLPEFLWGELARTAVYILNRVSRAGQKITPFELWFNRKPLITNLRRIGAECYAHVPTSQRDKLSPTAKRGILVGYGSSEKFYKVYFHKERKVKEVKDVQIIETKRGISETKSTRTLIEPIECREKEPQMNRMQLRPRAKIADACDIEVPSTHQQAMASPLRKNWLKAMKDEMESMIANETWTLAVRPNNRNIVGNKWVYSIKENLNGETRFKARLVARGFTQQEGIDYDEIYSPVARMDTVRLLLALAAKFTWNIRQFDVSTAFLNAPIDREV